MKRHFLLVALVFWGASSWARADDDKVLKVPFDTLKTQHIVVEVKINDMGPYRLIFDTGAPVTLISTRIAKDSGVVPKDSKVPGMSLFSVPEFKIKEFQIGEVKASNLTTMVMDHPTVSAIDKVLGPVDGIVGLSFFGKYRFTIDYKAKEMTFAPVDFRPPDVMKQMAAMFMSDKDPEKKVVGPAGQWGFSVSKNADDDEAGVVVKTVLPESPAARAGLKEGDRVLTLDGALDGLGRRLLPGGQPCPARHGVEPDDSARGQGEGIEGTGSSRFVTAPILAQHCHEVSVPVTALAEMLLAQDAFLFEADLLVTANGTFVVFEDLEPDTIEIERGEGIPHHQPRDIGAVAFAPVELFADSDAEGGVTAAPVNLMKGGGANRGIISLSGDHEGNVGMTSLHLIEVVGLVFQGERSSGGALAVGSRGR